jgi:hypothetical protein
MAGLHLPSAMQPTARACTTRAQPGHSPPRRYTQHLPRVMAHATALVLAAVAAAAVVAADAAPLSAPGAAAAAATVPSLRNGLPGTALAGHRWIEVKGGAQLAANLSGVPSHLHWTDGGGLQAIVPPEAWTGVESLLGGREYRLVQEDMQEMLEQEKSARVAHPYKSGAMKKDEFYRAWRTLEEIDDYMDTLRSGAPFGMNITDVVVGETNQGREIRGVKLSSPRGPGTEPLPKVFMHGCHHSGEWITAMGTVYFFEQLVVGYQSDPNIIRLLEGFEWILVPVINVDGFEFAWNNDAFRTWRKTRSIHPENVEAWAACELVTPGSCEGCFGTSPDLQSLSLDNTLEQCWNDFSLPYALVYRTLRMDDPDDSFVCGDQSGTDPNRNWDFQWCGGR